MNYELEYEKVVRDRNLFLERVEQDKKHFEFMKVDEKYNPKVIPERCCRCKTTVLIIASRSSAILKVICSTCLDDEFKNIVKNELEGLTPNLRRVK